MPGQVLGVPAQRRQRVSQLVRRVGDEAALALPRSLEGRQHPVQGIGQPGHLVGRAAVVRARQPQRGIAAPLDHLGTLGERLERAQRAAGEHERDRGDEQRSRERAGHDQRARLVQGGVDLVGRRPDHDGAARGWAAERRERCGVEADVPGGQIAVAVNAPVRADRLQGQVSAREGRAGQLAPVAVDHLDLEPASLDRRLEHRGRRQERRRRRRELGHLGGPVAQRAVERLVQMAREQHLDGRPEHDHGGHDRHGRGRDDAGAQTRCPRAQPPAHLRRTKPAPLTVWISGGSPSLRRR